MSAGAVVARILTQYSDKGSKAAQKDIAKLGKQIDAFGKKAAKSFALAVTATAALSIKIGKDAVQAAIEDAKSQVLLANALQTSTGATSAATAAAENYIKATMLRVNVADEELRASLGMLVVATGDLTEAERLQGIALDVAAASGKDLYSATVAITKAQQGNVSALKKLSPELSGLIQQGMKAEEVFLLLEGAYGGTAEKLADLDPFKKLQLAYGETLETLGTELLPVVKEFVDIIVKDVLPAVEAWIKANGTELRDGIKAIVDLSLGLIKTFGDLAKFYNKYDWIVKLAFSMFAFGRAAKIVAKFAGPLSNMFRGLAKGSTTVKDVLEKLFVMIFSKSSKEPAVFAGIAKVLSRVAKIIGGIAAGFLGIGTAGIAASNGLKSLFGIDAWPWEENVNNATKAIAKVTDATKVTANGPFAETIKGAVKAAAAAKKLAEARARAAAQAAADARAQAAADAKAAKEKAKQDAIEKKNIALKAAIEKKYAVKITDADEYENIQLTAVEKLLKKQKDADASLTERIKLRREELALFNALNQNAQRYTDLLTALADEKLSNEEIELLAKKWGLTVDAAKSYIFTIFAIKDEQVSDDEVTKLATAWGITKAQAAQYLDFFAALNDGKLSDQEIAKLMAKWGLTKEEATKYADFISKIGDGKLDDKEIENLKSKWGMTTDQVVAYIIKIGGKVDATGTILSAGDIAALGWTNALNALNAYLAALGKGTGGTPQNPVVPPTVVVPPKTGDSGLGGSKTDSAATAAANAAAAASSRAAAEYASAMASGDIAKAAIAAAKVSPTALASQESGAIGALSISTQLKAAEQARLATVSNLKAAEALSAKNDSAASIDYDSKFRSMSSNTIDTAKGLMGSGMNSGGSTNIIVNVAGSIQSQEDITEAIRQGLLAGQTNGKTLTLQAI